MRAEKFLLALHAHPWLPDRDRLDRVALEGTVHARLNRLARVERAASGRARCRSCKEVIEKGHLRLALQFFDEGRFTPGGTIHVACAQAYFGTAAILERVSLIQELDDDLRRALAEQLTEQRSTRAFEVGSTISAQVPGLAKTQPGEEDERSAAGAQRGQR